MITDRLRSIQSSYGDHTPTLVAVSKKQSDEKIIEALDAGLRIFGENRVQEAQSRWTHRRAPYPDLDLHLIGPLQTNKVKDAVQLFDCIHTVDREKLARAIHTHAPDMPCFIQVNVGDEPQKSGIARDNVNAFHTFCIDLGLNIIGLMCIPPNDDNSAPHYEWMRDKARDLKLPHLSMGMSRDYETALHYGATHIRIGSKLFGARE
ncbi:MAG: YggS family pyridoxal phosphate-dependent enzyme [Alphaproteobacteria bacterium]|nr:MAG: YggS family pyridoxal phosphate-dependent enzyme [Alphaproteobacteria bacterium]